MLTNTYKRLAFHIYKQNLVSRYRLRYAIHDVFNCSSVIMLYDIIIGYIFCIKIEAIDVVAVLNLLALFYCDSSAFYLKHLSRLSSVTHEDIFWAMPQDVVKTRKQSIHFYPKISRDCTEWYKFIVVVNFSSRLASLLFKLKATIIIIE